MNVEAIPRFVRGLSFRQAVWLAPLCFSVHIAEEAPTFAAWVSAHFAPGFPISRFVINNAIAMVVLTSLAAVASATRAPAAVFAFFVWLYFQIFWNAMFHIGATAWFGVYSPGVMTAVFLYLPLTYRLTVLAHRERLIGNTAGAVALVAGFFMHCWLVSALASGFYSTR